MTLNNDSQFCLKMKLCEEIFVLFCLSLLFFFVSTDHEDKILPSINVIGTKLIYQNFQ